jgi:hypothetical protein
MAIRKGKSAMKAALLVRVLLLAAVSAVLVPSVNAQESSVSPVLRNFRYPTAKSPTEDGSPADGTTVFHAQVRQVVLMLNAYEGQSDNAKRHEHMRAEELRLLVDEQPVKLDALQDIQVIPMLAMPGTWTFARTPAGAWGLAYNDVFITHSYYLASFTPPESVAGLCHNVRAYAGNLTVLVDPSRYCYTNREDPLLGSALGDEMAAAAQHGEPGGLSLMAGAGYFYVAPGVAQLHIVAEFSQQEIHFNFLGGRRSNTTINLLGLIRRGDGTLAARFSDVYDKMSMGRSHLEAITPSTFSTEVELAPGDYRLDLVLDDGQRRGVTSLPLHIDAYDGKTLGLSTLLLTARTRTVDDWNADVPRLPVIKPSPLAVEKTEYIPTASHELDRKSPFHLYFEIYEPALAQTGVNPSAVSYRLHIVDENRGKTKLDTGRLDASRFIQPGSIVVPIGLKLNLGKQAHGCYRLEVQGFDSLGQQTPVRTEAFCVQ